MRFTFNTPEQYIEAWMYMMCISGGFTYCRDEQWIEPALDEEDDELNGWTVKRLKQITEG